MQLLHSPHPDAYQTLSTSELREHFLLEDLFTSGQCNMSHWDVDRTIIASAVPTQNEITLSAPPEIIAADYFLERREVGIMNLAGPGQIITDGKEWDINKCETLYVGRGTQSVSMKSVNPEDPAYFYLISYPAHADYPTALATEENTKIVSLGSSEGANERRIFQQIHLGGIQSCQLVMGYTELATGSVWNTFPPHTHTRRSEVYTYFDMDPDQVVMHFMGPAEASRNLVMRNHQTVLSPPWSMHCGVGSASYKFVWAMGGENQEFTDMDPIPLTELL